jgi:hypothetical protein
MSLRKPETEQRYQDDLKNGRGKSLWDEEIVYDDEDYRVVKNRYPYDLIATEHVMLLPKKPDMDKAISWATIYAMANSYTKIIYNLPKAQSVKNIIHVHIIK